MHRLSIALFALALFVASCAQQPSETAAPELSDDQQQRAAEPGGASPPTDGTPAGIVLVKCGGFSGPGVEVVTINPTSGAVSQTAQFSSPTSNCVGASALDIRISFDRDYGRIAEEWGVGADESRYVGWQDFAGRSVDITAEYGESEFSGVPQDTNPYFHPITGEFHYTTKSGDLMAVASGGGQPARIGTAEEDRYSAAADLGRSLADDASVAMSTDFTGVDYYVVLRYAEGTTEGFVVDPPPLHPYSWHGTDYALSHSANLVTGALGHELTATIIKDGGVEVRSLLPETTRKVWTPIASPDGNEVAFLASQGDEVAVWKVGIAGGEAVKIADLTWDEYFSEGLSGFGGSYALVNWLP